MADFLKTGRNVVVDDANLTRDLRRPYILPARLYGAAARAVFFTGVRAARYRNSKRVGDYRMPEDAATGQLARMERPTGEEGLDSVLAMGCGAAIPSRPTSTGSWPFAITAATPLARQPCSPGSRERAGAPLGGRPAPRE